jgi:hypothetical protein
LWRVYRDGGCSDSPWLMGLWSTQAKVEGIVRRDAWHWGRNSSVFNFPLEEPGRTPFYVGLLSVWVSTDSDVMFFPLCRRALFWGLQQQTNE